MVVDRGNMFYVVSLGFTKAFDREPQRKLPVAFDNMGSRRAEWEVIMDYAVKGITSLEKCNTMNNMWTNFVTSLIKCIL